MASSIQKNALCAMLYPTMQRPQLDLAISNVMNGLKMIRSIFSNIIIIKYYLECQKQKVYLKVQNNHILFQDDNWTHY